MEKIKSGLKYTKTMGLPALALITIAVIKLHIVGFWNILYLLVTDTPIYMENGTMGWVQLFVLLMLDIAVGGVYVWARDKHNGDNNKNTNNKTEDPKISVVDEGFNRGFNYIWMGGVTSIVVSLVWTLITVLVTGFFQEAIVSYPTTVLMLYTVLGSVHMVISGVIKRGILIYAVSATYSINNVFKAVHFAMSRVFKVVLIEGMYYVWVLIGLMLAGVGVFVTVPYALENKMSRWDKLVREYERDSVYAILNKKDK